MANDRVIKAVTSPIGFFVLALLITETLLGTSLALVQKPISEYFYWFTVGLGALLFVLVIILVWLMVWYRPKNLIFGEAGHIRDRILEQSDPRVVTTEADLVNVDKYYKDIFNQNYHE